MFQVLCIGLTGSGKTSLIYAMSKDNLEKDEPTVGKFFYIIIQQSVSDMCVWLSLMCKFIAAVRKTDLVWNKPLTRVNSSVNIFHLFAIRSQKADYRNSCCKCCILTLNRAVNQRFSAQDAPVKISGSSHVVERKCVGVMKGYIHFSSVCNKKSKSWLPE